MPWACFKKSSPVDDFPSELPDSKSFFVIAAIFNPASFESRYTLYHNFAEHMKETGAQLMTIECIFPTLNQHEFQVTNPNNPYHIQLKSESIYWMKENLINIAVAHLPPHAKWVCWLDADIYFHKSNWVELTIKELKKFSVVQIFKKAKFLGPPPQNAILRTDYSFGYSVVHGKIIDQQRYDEWYPHPGYGWAMSVDAFRQIEGLPDYDIVGSGDLHFAFALVNKVSNAIEDNLNPQFKNMILNHSEATYNILKEISRSESKSIVGYVPVTISHYWHGSRKDRQYVNRWKVLIAHNFNYLVDAWRKDDGLLELSPEKPLLQKDILAHFQMRKEDRKNTYETDDYKIGKKKRPVRRRSSDSDHLVPYFVDVGDNCHLPLPDDADDGDDCQPPPWGWNDGNPPIDENTCRPDDKYVNYLCSASASGYVDNYNGTIQCSSQY